MLYEESCWKNSMFMRGQNIVLLAEKESGVLCRTFCAN